MSAFDGIKEKVGVKALLKEVQSQSRFVRPCNYTNAASIGLLYLAADKTMHLQCKKFIKYLKEEEGIRTVRAMGYFPGKEVPEYLHATHFFDFFTVKDLNFKRSPSGTNIENFITEPFDILIDLTKGENVPLLYLLVRSKARFKVGPRVGILSEYYDLMITPEKEYNQEEFLKQTNHFLQILNQKTA